MRDIVIGSGVIGTATTLVFHKKGRKVLNISKSVEQLDTASVGNGCYVVRDYQPSNLFKNIIHYLKGNINFHGSFPPLRPFLFQRKGFIMQLCRDGADHLEYFCKREGIERIKDKNNNGYFIDGHLLNLIMKDKAEGYGASFV